MMRAPPISTRTDPLFPCTSRVRAFAEGEGRERRGAGREEGDRADRPAAGQGCGARGEAQCADRRARRGLWQARRVVGGARRAARGRSEEHTSELQYRMRRSYAVLCLKNKILFISTHLYYILT